MKILIIMVALIMATAVQARQSRFGDVPARLNYDAVIKLTEDCISTRINEVQTDMAMQYLIQGCFHDVKRGNWDKRSRQRYIKEQKWRARHGN